MTPAPNREEGVFIYLRLYWVTFLQITSSPRSNEMKTTFYQLMAEELMRLGFRKEDLFISITPSNPEDWSFGNGIAQLLEQPKE